MNRQDAIKHTLSNYLRAFYSRDFDTMYELLYEEDVQQYRDTMVGFAKKMDAFGETQDFLDKLKIANLERLESLSLKGFMDAILAMVTREIGDEHIIKMLDGMEITNIDDVEHLSVVTYTYPVEIFGNWERMQSDVQMIETDKGWRLFFKSGLERVFASFQNEIDLYYERKSRDILSNLSTEPESFRLMGFKDMETGKVVIEPRFKDVGEFSDGLAYVKIMRKYGFIDLKGDIVIKPQYDYAGSFYEKRAAVRIGDSDAQYGFINRKGKLVLDFQYDDVERFSEGLCAVKLEGKWGYIDKKGDTVIPFKFDSAGDFEFGTAYVDIETEEGELVEFILDKKGNIKELH